VTLSRVLLLATCLLTLPLTAATFTVDATTDTPDATPGDGICADALAQCTLRAAVDEANANPDADTIGFSAAHSIVTSGLLLTNVVTIDGSTAPGYAGVPLVRVAAAGALHTFNISGTAVGSVLDALIITGPAEHEVYFATSGTVKRSYIGAVTGAVGELGATRSGVFTTAGATVYVTDCVVGGNDEDGIVAFGFTQINGCLIGLRPDGSTPASNGQHGVYVAGPTWIGDTSRNVISANGVDGVNGSLGTPDMGSNGAWIRGNYIGTDATGLFDRGNGRHGVVMNGDHTLTELNVISGNGEHGVLSNYPARHILAFIEANKIGLGSDGTTVIPNGIDGVHLTGNNITVGGNPVAKRNFISGNTRAGIYIDAGSVAHSIANNYIGTDVTGALDRGNGQEGIYCEGRILMGSNVVSGNDGQAGVAIIEPAWASLAGNIIGLDATGTTPVPNANDGIVITSNDSFGVRIGGAFAGAKNVVSGNNGNGIVVNGQNAQVAANYIGTDITGTLARPNGFDGVSVGASNVLIGGDVVDAINVISGNTGSGISIASANVTVQGNRIGTNAAGTAALPNADGVTVAGNALANVLIGGTTGGTENLISGNTGRGVSVTATNATGITIQRNLIGTQIDGGSPLGNGDSGVVFVGAGTNGSLVGGSSLAAGNTIAFHTNGGIALNAGTGTTVSHNVIRNNGAGISLSASGNAVTANDIHQNTLYGVAVGVGVTGNRISENTIFQNGGLGIDLLLPFGTNANDPGDPDIGGNTLQNYPVLTGAYLHPGPGGRAAGTLNSTPNTTFTLEFFGNDAGDPEGLTFLGSASVTTDGGGNAVFDAPLATAPTLAATMTATATDPNDNTSEFSAALAITQPGVLSFDSATYAVGEAGPAVMITVNRTGGSDGTVSAVATAGGGDAESTDYDVTPQTITFGPGVVTQSVTIAITSDTIDEADETFNVTLGGFTGGAIAGVPATTAVTINDNDDPPIIDIFDMSIDEQAATLNFTISLSNASESAVSVDYTTADVTATAGADYTAASNTATIAAGNLFTTVAVPILEDTIFEADETFSVTISAPVNGTLGDTTATGTITNDDGEPSASVNDPAAAEGTTMTFSVTLSNPSSTTTTIDYATDGGTATPGADYTATSGTLTFNPGVTEQFVNVTVAADAVDEGDETIGLLLSNGTVTDGFGEGTITDDDTATITISDANIGEGGTMTFDVLLTTASAFTITVDYATGGGSAAAGGDYTAASGTVTFAPGITAQTIDVTTVSDLTAEGNETFEVTLTNPSNATIADGTATGTIIEDDGAPQIAILDDAALESAGMLVFDVLLSNPSAQDVSVQYTTTGVTATTGSDFTAFNGMITIAAGSGIGTINIPIAADATYEPDETLTVTLSNPTNATILDGTATGTITNDDPLPSISISDPIAGEGNGGATNVDLALTLSNPSASTITVDYATGGGSATSGDDYTPASGTATFPAGSVLQIITVAILGDTTTEPNESVDVNLTNPANATLAETTGVLTIIDDETQPAISIGDATANEEDGTVTFLVTLSNASAQTVTVDYATGGGSGTAGQDYTGAAGTLTFAPGIISQPIVITLMGDALYDGNETFTVALSNATNAAIADGSATGTIVSDEPQLTISIADDTKAEGNGPLSFTVSLSNASATDITVDYATGGGTATPGLDYTAAAGTLTIPAGTLSVQLLVTLADDAVAEGDETLQVTLSNPSGATLGDATATGTIAEDDAAAVASDIPTASEWMLILMAALLALAAVRGLR